MKFPNFRNIFRFKKNKTIKLNNKNEIVDSTRSTRSTDSTDSTDSNEAIISNEAKIIDPIDDINKKQQCYDKCVTKKNKANRRLFIRKKIKTIDIDKICKKECLVIGRDEINQMLYDYINAILKKQSIKIINQLKNDLTNNVHLYDNDYNELVNFFINYTNLKVSLQDKDYGFLTTNIKKIFPNEKITLIELILCYLYIIEVNNKYKIIENINTSLETNNTDNLDILDNSQTQNQVMLDQIINLVLSIKKMKKHKSTLYTNSTLSNTLMFGNINILLWFVDAGVNDYGMRFKDIRSKYALLRFNTLYNINDECKKIYEKIYDEFNKYTMFNEVAQNIVNEYIQNNKNKIEYDQTLDNRYNVESLKKLLTVNCRELLKSEKDFNELTDEELIEYKDVYNEVVAHVKNYKLQND